MRRMDRWTVCRRLASMARPVSFLEAALMAVVAACIVLGKWFDVMSIKRRGLIINGLKDIKGMGSANVSSIYGDAAAFLVLRTLSSAFTESKAILFSAVTNRVVQASTSRILDLTMHAAHSCEIKPTELNRIVERGNRKISKVLVKTLTVATPALFRLALLFREVHAMFGPKYLVPILFTAAAYAAYTCVMLRIRARYRKEINNADNSVSRRIHECVSNVDLVRACCSEQFEVSRLAGEMETMWALKLSDKGCVGMTNLGQRALFSVLFVHVAFKGIADMAALRMTVGDLSVLFSFVLSIDASMWTLGGIARDLGFWLTDCTDLLCLHDGLERAAEQGPGAGAAAEGMAACPSSPPGEAAAVEFDDVSFAYPRSAHVLSGVSFRIMRGERVGIIGRPGSGKSTILKLILMLHRHKGRIRVNGAELWSASPRAVRGSIGCILQDGLLFDESILYNVMYGCPGAGFHRVLRECKNAGLSDVVRRKGLHSRMKALSGGEMQMVSLARCFLKDAPLMLLDEATSKLDAETERDVFGLMMGMRGKTIVMVLHDLWMTEHLDRVILVDSGTVKEVGTHSELMGLRGMYWRMKTASRE
ncbi:ABC transporter protein [Encephalitozoon cuniculi]|nr:ABC transporter [Encephalitozoon cuniculi]UYI28516.1 ABC transporter protein [Encephalitozoon cuniculi]